jgi:UDP-GlcNAc:undecaprenyl-phosphate GlcNAc-1-phosphate transferase
MMETGTLASKLAPLLAGIVSAVFTAVLMRNRSLPLDNPNTRSLHVVPVPRTGGIAIVAGIAAADLWLRAPVGLLAPAAALAIISYLDDRHALPAWVRLAIHLLAAGAFLWWAAASAGLPMLIFLLIAIGWVTNLYNFMDGSDGLAGGMTVIGFCTYGLAAWLGGSIDLGLLAWSIAAAAAGFLIFNFPPAKIFMGDVGSIPMGFLACAVGVDGWLHGIWPPWFPLIAFAPFIVDATITLARRLLRGERVWQAHRQHYYQRLILSGWSHRRTAISAYAVMFTCGAVAVLCRQGSPITQGLAIGTLILFFAGTMWIIDRRWPVSSLGKND